MPKLFVRLGLTVLFALSTTVAQAALISIREEATGGGGTLVSDGSGDVSSSDGSAGSPGIDALLLSSYGFTNGNLAGDLTQFSITGSFTDSAGEATSVTLSQLWLIGTFDAAACPVPLSCGLLTDVDLGSSLSFDNNDPLNNTRNVLFAIPLVGAPAPGAWVGPSGLSSPQEVPIGSNAFTYGLTTDQIAFIAGNASITGRMSGISVDQVRLGLSASASGIAPITVQNPLGQQDVRQVYDLQGPATTPVPEPGSMLLLATGLASARLWRKRQLSRRGVR